MPDPAAMLAKIHRWLKKPVVMGYMVTGKFRSRFFPNGIEVALDPNKPEDAALAKSSAQQPAVTRSTIKRRRRRHRPSVRSVVFSDVDFHQRHPRPSGRQFFGLAAVGDNAALMMNGRR